MATLRIQCPQCRQTLKLPSVPATGRSMLCPQCSQRFQFDPALVQPDEVAAPAKPVRPLTITFVAPPPAKSPTPKPPRSLPVAYIASCVAACGLVVAVLVFWPRTNAPVAPSGGTASQSSSASVKDRVATNPAPGKRGDGTSGSGSTQLTGERYALLIGVKGYSKNSGLRPLNYTERDVDELADVLLQSGYRKENVLVMSQTRGAADTRQLPIGQNIMQELKALLRDREETDSVLVAFAGHGMQYRGSDETFFCPADAKAEDRTTLVSLKSVYDQLDQCRAGFKLLLNDACRNDPVASGSRSISTANLESSTRPQRLIPPGGLAVLFSCSEGEFAWEDDGLKHGVFLHFVIDGLKGNADLDKDGQINLEELSLYTKKRVPDFVRAEFGGERQMPHLINNSRGLVPIVLLPKRSVPLPAVVPSTPNPNPRLSNPPSVPASQPSPPQPSATSSSQRLDSVVTSASTGMKLALIPAGTFRMGSSASEAERREDEGPQHSVTISQPFYMGVCEVTQAEYESVMATNPSYFSKTGGGSSKLSGQDTSKFPVEMVSWYDAIEFCNKLSAKDNLTAYYSLTNVQRESGLIKSATVTEVSRAASAPALLGYRLPTEAEWEYACRANTTTPFYFGGVLNADKANVIGKYGTTSPLMRTTTVRSYNVNSFGLFDMHGNVCEWCEDVFDKKVYATRAGTTTDPLVKIGSDYHVLRGYSWENFGSESRSARRDWSTPGTRANNFGIRVVCVGMRTQ